MINIEDPYYSCNILSLHNCAHFLLIYLIEFRSLLGSKIYLNDFYVLKNSFEKLVSYSVDCDVREDF